MTDQPKWTPGPWAMETVRTSCGTCHRIGPFPRPAYASKPEGWACVYDDYPPGVGSPDLLANSRLMAAAPDLYAALDDLLASYAEPDQQICCGGHGCGCRGASVRDLAEHHARAALAKARGQA